MYRHIIDPGHSWLEVPLRDLRAVGFTPTHYSYYDPQTSMTYLEEDCDMPDYIHAKVGTTDREALMSFFITRTERVYVNDFKREFSVYRPIPN